MLWLLIVLAMLVPAGDGFGDASASAESIGTDLIRVEVAVSIDGAGSVVAHVIEPGGEQQTVALADRGGGEFGAVFESRPIDLVVVFEVLGDRPRQSDPLRLTDLGVPRSVLGMSPPLVEVVDEPDDNAQWGWLGLGLGAAALALLAIWTLGGGATDESAVSAEIDTETEDLR